MAFAEVGKTIESRFGRDEELALHFGRIFKTLL